VWEEVTPNRERNLQGAAGCSVSQPALASCIGTRAANPSARSLMQLERWIC
jgi:hypothetical protein